MASYTSIEKSDLIQILKLYPQFNSDVQTFKPLSLGISNSNYRVELTDGTILLLKISNDKNANELSEEMIILNYLKEKNFPYSLCPFSLHSAGNFVYHYENLFGVIFPFVDGIPPGPSDATSFEVGRALALLHQTPYQLNSRLIRSHEKVGFGPLEIKKYLEKPACPEEYKIAIQAFFPKNLLNELIEAPFPKGIIHGDLYYDNTLFDLNHLKTLLDFEQAGIGEFVLDLGISISGTALEKGHIITPLINSYLEGYQSIRKLTDLEKNYLPHAIVLGLMSIALWRIKRFREKNLNPLMANSYLDLVNRATLFKEQFQLRDLIL